MGSLITSMFLCLGFFVHAFNYLFLSPVQAPNASEKIIMNKLFERDSLVRQSQVRYYTTGHEKGCIL